MVKIRATSISEYIRAAPKEIQPKLRELREILKEAAPKATEAIKWGSPVFEEGRILYSFSLHRTHINFMPTRTTLEHFKDELADFKTGKDTIQLPFDKPIPKALIKKIAKFRAKDVKENGAKWMM